MEFLFPLIRNTVNQTINHVQYCCLLCAANILSTILLMQT